MWSLHPGRRFRGNLHRSNPVSMRCRNVGGICDEEAAGSAGADVSRS
jgi:hypothetical protein